MWILSKQSKQLAQAHSELELLISDRQRSFRFAENAL